MQRSAPVHLVLEVTGGQLVHDFVTGAFIVIKGGACLVTRDGDEISYNTLESYLLQPERRFEYVAAANRKLALEIVELLKDVV